MRFVRENRCVATQRLYTKRFTPMARRQYISCRTVSLMGTEYPAGIQPSGQDDFLWPFSFGLFSLMAKVYQNRNLAI